MAKQACSQERRGEERRWGERAEGRHRRRGEGRLRVCRVSASLADDSRGMKSSNLGVDLFQLLQLLAKLPDLALQLVDRVSGGNGRQHEGLTAKRRHRRLGDGRNVRGRGRLRLGRRHRSRGNDPAQHGRRRTRDLGRVRKCRLDLLVERRVGRGAGGGLGNGHDAEINALSGRLGNVARRVERNDGNGGLRGGHGARCDRGRGRG